MSWRDELQPASFRGTPFFVDQASGEGARRVVVHEYPLQEKAETEDLGARAKRILVNGYVLGNDYFGARDELMLKLDMPGPGELVHPYRGTFQAQLISYRMTESTREGGMARFDMEFIEAAFVTGPSVRSDTPRRVLSQAEATVAASQAQFVEAWPLRLAAEFDRAVATVLDAVRTVETVIGVVTVAQDEIAGIVGLPDRIANRLRVDLRRIRDLASLRRLFAYRAPAGSNTRGALANAAALSALVQQQAVIAAAELSAAVTFDSQTQALGVQEELADAIERVSYAADDQTFEQLQELRARLIEDIRSRAVDLSRIERYTPTETVPALVIAQRLYGVANGIDALLGREADIVKRNAVAHPGFVRGGVALEVLSD
ncbi:DNA circularization N-terminal domain-containing protein [Nevskia sp.]|uniref:DNA circularization protein n=1 Tax=Nevskia sp. TaxID=1929292 RepID=UPI0025DE8D6C|nr:DNA circularization N-terminal domain-containing protein [Nevskia sp.]